jgi:hypothetical protein
MDDLPLDPAGQPGWRGREGADEGEREDGGGGSEGEVAVEHAAGGRRAAGGQPERHEARAEIGSEHEDDREGQADHACARERHREEHEGDRRVEEPGEARPDQEGEDRVGREALEDEEQHVAVAHRLGGGDDQAERQDHQPEAEDDTADLPGAVAARHEGERDAARDQHRHHGVEVEGEDLHDERGAEIGAEHDREGRRERDHAARDEGREQHRDGGRALQARGGGAACPGGADGTLGGAGQHPAQRATEAAQDPGPDHGGTPQQQRDAAEEVEKDHVAGQGAPSGWSPCLSRCRRENGGRDMTVP